MIARLFARPGAAIVLPLVGGLLVGHRPPPPASRPLRHCMHQAVWDAAAGRSNPALIQNDAWGGMTLIDGLAEAGYTADLWSLDLGGDAPGWVESSPAAIAPAPRASRDAALLDGAISLFGGFGNDGALADFWRLEGAGGASS